MTVMGDKPIKHGEPTTLVRVPISPKQDVIDSLLAPLWPEPPPSQRPAEHPEKISIPLFAHSVQAGFPSPADDYAVDSLDLNAHLIRNKEATFFLRCKGHSMVGAGIHDNDLLLVDRSLTPFHGHIVIAVVDGEFTVKRLFKRGGITRLIAESPDYVPIEFSEGQELLIWGVVTNVIHRLLP